MSVERHILDTVMLGFYAVLLLFRGGEIAQIPDVLKPLQISAILIRDGFSIDDDTKRPLFLAFISEIKHVEATSDTPPQRFQGQADPFTSKTRQDYLRAMLTVVQRQSVPTDRSRVVLALVWIRAFDRFIQSGNVNRESPGLRTFSFGFNLHDIGKGEG